MNQTQQEDQIKKTQEIIESILSWATRACATVLSILGLPGFLILLGYYFIVTNASDLQRQQIIDKYVLFETTSNCSNGLMTILVFFITVFYIYMRYNHRKHKIFQMELDRCGNEKSILQNSIGKFKSTKS